MAKNLYDKLWDAPRIPHDVAEFGRAAEPEDFCEFGHDDPFQGLIVLRQLI